MVGVEIDIFLLSFLVLGELGAVPPMDKLPVLLLAFSTAVLDHLEHKIIGMLLTVVNNKKQ